MKLGSSNNIGKECATANQEVDVVKLREEILSLVVDITSGYGGTTVE